MEITLFKKKERVIVAPSVALKRVRSGLTSIYVFVFVFVRILIRSKITGTQKPNQLDGLKFLL